MRTQVDKILAIKRMKQDQDDRKARKAFEDAIFPLEFFWEFDHCEENGTLHKSKFVVKDANHALVLTGLVGQGEAVMGLVGLVNDYYRNGVKPMSYDRKEVKAAIDSIENEIKNACDQLNQLEALKKQLVTQSEHLHRAMIAFDYLDNQKKTDAAVKGCP